ncbi:MAG: hypothetical protein IKC91_01975 [Clostridia bacterium]|nr:hypothetical protein [Clostridia bacterium]
MKKLLLILMAIACFCSLVIFTACDGSGNSSASNFASPSGSTASASSDSPSDSSTPDSTAPDSTASDSTSGDNAGDSDQNEGDTQTLPVIQIKSNVTPFTEDRTENITIRSVPKTDTEFDVENFDFSFEYSKADLSRIELRTDNIDNVFAFFDAKLRKFPSHRNGLLMLPNANDVEGWNVSYEITHEFSYDIVNEYDLNDIFKIRCQMEGYIQLPDGREYYTYISFTPITIISECATGSYFGDDSSVRYVCYDGDEFLSKSYLAYPKTSLGSGIPSNTWCDLGIYYQSDNAENPYKENMVPSNYRYYYADIFINIYDALRYNPNNNPELTEEEAQLVYGQLYETIKNSFVVYDYEHYSKQFDKEK